MENFSYFFMPSKMMSAIKIAAKIHVTIEMSFAFFPVTLQITYEMIPKAIPFEIEYPNGITIIVINAGIPSVKSVKSIEETDFIIKNPTKISAGAVAAAGTSAKSGLKNSAKRNKTAVVTEASPVLPPAATPEELSTNDVTVEVPRHAPTAVPIASAKSAPFAFNTFPSLSLRFPCSATPRSVPIVSKRSVKRKVKKITRNFPKTAKEKPFPFETIPLKSKSKKYGAEGAFTGEKSFGIAVTPNGIPIKVVITIPIKIEPGTFKI